MSHESATIRHGMSPVVERQPTITVSHRSTHSFPGVSVHQATDLLDTHTESIGLLRITNRPRTIVDLAKVLHPTRLARLVDNSLGANLVSFDDLSVLFAALARKGKPGVQALRRILDERALTDSFPESELESLFLQVLRNAGLPDPSIQFAAQWLKPINGRVDFAYPDKRIVIEVDGRRWHAMHDAFESDRKRDNAAQLSGWRILRFTWRMVTTEPMSVVDTVRKALFLDSRES